jgi:hypothetical protein
MFAGLGGFLVAWATKYIMRVREITIWTTLTISSTVEKVILFVAAECKPKFMVLVKN